MVLSYTCLPLCVISWAKHNQTVSKNESNQKVKPKGKKLVPDESGISGVFVPTLPFLLWTVGFVTVETLNYARVKIEQQPPYD